MLLTLYTHDLPTQIIHLKCHMFADDAQLFIGVDPSNPNIVNHKPDQNLERIQIWSTEHGLPMNPVNSE